MGIAHGRSRPTPPAPRTPPVAAFLGLLIITLLTAIPLVIAVLARARWDQPGVHCRRLHPLWRDLTTAVPEVGGAGQSARCRTHRTGWT
ncbi:DUF6545 domain-containing protein [Nocardia amamiensis]|uniref:DUF6545 domain-containing protein n=1 Tax=Nocardia amamiensis TaxID=404578 RepID=UPI000B23EA37